VDDVIADLHTPWIKRCNAAAGTNYTAEDMKQWDFWRDFGYTEEFIYKHLTPDIYDYVRPYPEALPTVQALWDAGHTVYYITTCHTREAWEAKWKWLQHHGFTAGVATAYPAGPWATHKTKGAVGKAFGVPVLVDDSRRNCEEWQMTGAGTAYLLTRPHNRNELYAGKRLRKLEELPQELKYWPHNQPTRKDVLPVGVNLEIESGLKVYEENQLRAQGGKPTNPKDAIATDKMPLHLVSGVVEAYAAIAHYLGNVKYGAWNYREGGARASIYLAALKRHIQRWTEGEENDPVDGTPHLANALACINILIEASENGNLVDDRPPSRADVLNRVYAKLEKLMPQIRDRYKDKNPKHFTIQDRRAA
jgi:5'(3')-deoxyribonucleotidase